MNALSKPEQAPLCLPDFITYFALERCSFNSTLLNKKQVLERSSQLLTQSLESISSQMVMEKLVARDRIGSCVLEHNISIPHARIEGLKQPLISVVVLKQPVLYDELNQLSSQLICGLLFPDENNDAHIQILQQLATLLSDPHTYQGLITATSAETIFEVITSKLS